MKLRMLQTSILSTALILSSPLLADTKDLTKNEYCVASGGTVEIMPVHFTTLSGNVYGWSKRFCSFVENGGFIAIGLDAFASKKPNLAATFMKKLPQIDSDSPLMTGGASNPSMNVCRNIGGTNVSFVVGSSDFEDKNGDSDICVFGDGSMVSAWSLIYMADNRTGYVKVKHKVRSTPLNITMPSKAICSSSI